jgi:hypothetical protein
MNKNKQYDIYPYPGLFSLLTGGLQEERGALIQEPATQVLYSISKRSPFDPQENAAAGKQDS